jgi:DegV family protein with EDD domain
MALFDVSSDSTCDLKKEYREKRNVYFAPLSFTMEKDGDIQMALDNFSSQDEYVSFYQKIREGAFPRTSKLNYAAHVEHFTKMAEAGVKEVVHFTISSGLADTINITKQAASDVEQKYAGFKVYAVDPLTATVGQGMLVEIAADCRDEGKTAQETYDYIMSLRQNIQHCIIPDNLFYLKKGGRVSAMSAAVGTVLNIKPMLSFDKDGKLAVLEKCKGMKKAFARVIEHMKLAPVCSNRPHVVVVHTDNEKGANALADLIKAQTGVNPKITIMGPVIGSHVGPSSVSCAWLSETTREQLHSAL